jgi:predicted AAA+ superfamily ATPase
MAYTKRIVDQELQDRLGAAGAVVLEGPKACGKTASAEQCAASSVSLDTDDEARRAVEIDANLVLEGETPRLIDEWQVAPAIWNHIRRAIDRRGKRGQFILTGSAVPADDASRHTGAGRMARLRMRPMSLFETGHSTGTTSVRALLDGQIEVSSRSSLTVADVTEQISRGGWPGHLDLTTPQALQATRDYLEEICRVDVSRLDNRTRDPQRVGNVLRSLARNVATYVSLSTLAADAPSPGGTLKEATVQTYLDSLERLMVVENQPAWAPHLRSKSRIRGAPKRHFTDPSLAVAALRTTPTRLLQDLNALGFLFESMVIRDLRIYAQAADAQVLQYRDNTGLEIDAIVESADGRWAALEIKLGGEGIDEGARNLLKLAERVDTAKCGPPAALAVVTASGYGYTRADGVSVVPVASLGP